MKEMILAIIKELERQRRSGLKLLKQFEWIPEEDGFTVCPECRGFNPREETATMAAPEQVGHAKKCKLGKLLNPKKKGKKK